MSFIPRQTNTAVNLFYMRVQEVQAENRLFSIVINRSHDYLN